jgi:hypothetical protein
MRALVLALVVLSAVPWAAGAATGPVLGGCPVLPATHAVNQDISGARIDPRSDAYIDSILAGGNDALHADFGGGGEYGIPFRVVSAAQRLVPVVFDEYGDESDPGPYPIPLGAPVERGGDRHVLVLQRERCRLYELYHARRPSPPSRGWRAGSGAVFDLRSGRPRPAGWTSADAAGLPILPLLARYDEVAAGEIRHALRFTVSRSQAGYVAPARHLASSDDDPRLPPMGLRLRLKRSFPISGYTGQSRVVLEALKRYGMIVADNGSDWFITGAADRRWDDEDLNQLKRVPGRAFEVVRHGPVRR